MKRNIVLVLACLLMPLVVLGQQAPRPAQRGGGGVSGKWWKSSAIVRSLELSEAQVMQLEAVYMQHQVRLASLRSVLLQSEEQLRVQLEAEQLNEAAISLLTAKIATTRLDLENENSEMTLGMRRVMTAGQWRALEKTKQGQLVFVAPQPTPRSSDDKSGEAVTTRVTVYDLKTTPEIEPPIPVSNPCPAYTAEARSAKVEGVMVLQAVIQKDGSVGDVKVLRGLGHGLDESTVESVKRSWRFKPPLLHGQPVNVLANIEITFRLF